MSMWRRKVYRMVMGSIIPVAWLVVGSRAVPLAIALFFITLLVLLEYEKWRHPKVWEYILNRSHGIFKKQPGRFTGETYFMLAVLIILVSFPEEIAVPAMFFLVFGDAGSGIIGTRYGRTKIFRGKTLEGLAGGILFNAVSALIIFPFLDMPFTLLMAGAITASFMEVLPLGVDDNLSVGISSALVMRLFLV